MEESERYEKFLIESGELDYDWRDQIKKDIGENYMKEAYKEDCKEIANA